MTQGRLDIGKWGRDGQPGWFIKRQDAVDRAVLDADWSELPQTVYREGATCGWTNTNAFSPALKAVGTEVFVTLLPPRWGQ